MSKIQLKEFQEEKECKRTTFYQLVFFISSALIFGTHFINNLIALQIN